MKRAMFLVFAVGMSLNVSVAKGEGAFSSCPTAVDLDKGIVVADPARKGVLYKRYRKLDGPLVGMSFINGILTNRKAVEYAGLFTHKYWQGENLVRYEEVLTDTDELLEFKPGTEHSFKSISYNPSNPSRVWRRTATYNVLKADNVELGGCSYSTVSIQIEGLLTKPDGEVVEDNRNYIYLPELMLKISSNFGDVSDVRNRHLEDEQKWPFSPNAGQILGE